MGANLSAEIKKTQTELENAKQDVVRLQTKLDKLLTKMKSESTGKDKSDEEQQGTPPEEKLLEQGEVPAEPKTDESVKKGGKKKTKKHRKKKHKKTGKNKKK
tara:strand:- start:465 stop:770 length:306 start_codon:yes stop_codon:yes gene_type:complete